MSIYDASVQGMTMLEEFTKTAMQGLLARYGVQATDINVEAVRIAKQTLDALEAERLK